MKNDILLLRLYKFDIYFFYCEAPWIFDKSAIQLSIIISIIINCSYTIDSIILSKL